MRLIHKSTLEAFRANRGTNRFGLHCKGIESRLTWKPQPMKCWLWPKCSWDDCFAIKTKQNKNQNTKKTIYCVKTRSKVIKHGSLVFKTSGTYSKLLSNTGWEVPQWRCWSQQTHPGGSIPITLQGVWQEHLKGAKDGKFQKKWGLQKTGNRTVRGKNYDKQNKKCHLMCST